MYIFCFLRPKDLLHGWYDLSYHINAVVCSVHIHIIIKDNDDFNDSISYFKHFSTQITHLKDERFFPTSIQVYLHLLTKIQFLSLTRCSKEQYQQIAPDNQPHLTHCLLLSAPCQFYERILFEQVRFPPLISNGRSRGAFIYLLNTTHTTNRTILSASFTINITRNSS